MGILDTTEHALKYEQCGIAETVKVLDKGSSWSGSF